MSSSETMLRMMRLRDVFLSAPPRTETRDQEPDIRRAMEESWDRRGIPRRLFAMMHSSRLGLEGGPEPTAALHAVSEFLDPGAKPTILVLAGGTGVGKTVAAAWGAAFHNGTMLKAMDLVRAGLFAGEEFWDALERRPLLVVDDLGQEPQDDKGYGLAGFADLLDRRYDDNRKTIVTTNLTAKQFQERYADRDGGRIRDRIREVGRYVELAGETRRKSYRPGEAA